MPTPILVDTDMALDDWMAVAYLLQTPAADVQAITLAATGEAHARPGVNTALRLLALTDAPAIDVASGRKTPLQGGHRFPLVVRLLMDVRFGLSLPRAKHRPSTKSAVEVLRRKLTEANEPVVMISLGPLTNLAELFDMDPPLTHKVAMLYVMGGALDVPGNIAELNKRIQNPHAEWNLFIDPHAAEQVFRSGVPVTLVPLDATNQVPLTDEYYARLASNLATPATRFVHRVIRRIRPLLSSERGLCFWDPLASVLATHPHIGSYEMRTVRVVEDEGEESGRVVDDPAGTRLRVCVGVDQAAFESIFLAGLNGEAIPAPAVVAAS